MSVKKQILGWNDLPPANLVSSTNNINFLKDVLVDSHKKSQYFSPKDYTKWNWSGQLLYYVCALLLPTASDAVIHWFSSKDRWCFASHVQNNTNNKENTDYDVRWVELTSACSVYANNAFILLKINMLQHWITYYSHQMYSEHHSLPTTPGENVSWIGLDWAVFYVPANTV